jgi:cell division protein FtsB
MKLAKMTAALAVAGLALPALAAGPDTATLQKLLERMEKLEARNAELEKEVKALKGKAKTSPRGWKARVSPNTSRN